MNQLSMGLFFFSLLREEEMAQFHDVIADPRYKAHPLLVISEHLSERLRQEEGKPL